MMRTSMKMSLPRCVGVGVGVHVGVGVGVGGSGSVGVGGALRRRTHCLEGDQP